MAKHYREDKQMAELIINENSMYLPDHIESDVKSKTLLNYHSQAFNENKKAIKKAVSELKTKIANFKSIQEKITSNELFLGQLEKIELERQSLYKKRNDYFESEKFSNPDQNTLIEDSEIRNFLNKDENYNPIGSISNLVFNISRINSNSRYAEAILRQNSFSAISIKLDEDQIEALKDIIYAEHDTEYESRLDALNTIEEELTLNRQYMENHLSTLLEDLL